VCGFPDGGWVGTAGDLARLTGLTTGAITSVIRRLKKAGLVTAKRDPADRRRVVVRLVSERLNRGIERYASYTKASNEDVYARYSLRKLETIADYHRRMADVLSAEIQKLTGKLE